MNLTRWRSCRPPNSQNVLIDKAAKARPQRCQRRAGRSSASQARRTRTARSASATKIANAIRRADRHQASTASIHADPPWRFEPYSRDTGLDRAADNHYPTMALDADQVRSRCRRPTTPYCFCGRRCRCCRKRSTSWRRLQLQKPLLMAERPKEPATDRKQNELLLIGTRQHPGTPRQRHFTPAGPARRAQRQADALRRDVIETIFPTLPRLETPVRQPVRLGRPWGNEAP